MAEPAYVALAQEYAGRIRGGGWGEGVRLPSQGEMAAAHGCSRDTVRKAVDLLRAEGLVRTVRGRGTFVVGGEAGVPASEHEIDRIRAIGNAIRRARLASELMIYYQIRIAELSGIRQSAIEEARDRGVSYTEIGRQLGLAESRLRQLPEEI
ncbi:GntR family transcriptional regulator [Nocardia panacis]|uniref:GntR family transcriptional regulator n=1 Tax=Nocardia panacis TaxID=2340916 RepID=A0A3A4KHN1_9NOCA|nr:GntR family transcriptional regulator [Nocardia panacis]RJO72330.1 GntR family transcriptional regulator [Nocardia panacis]